MKNDGAGEQLVVPAGQNLNQCNKPKANESGIIINPLFQFLKLKYVLRFYETPCTRI